MGRKPKQEVDGAAPVQRKKRRRSQTFHLKGGVSVTISGVDDCHWLASSDSVSVSTSGPIAGATALPDYFAPPRRDGVVSEPPQERPNSLLPPWAGEILKSNGYEEERKKRASNRQKQILEEAGIPGFLDEMETAARVAPLDGGTAVVQSGEEQ